jgi:hypothetical protein
VADLAAPYSARAPPHRGACALPPFALLSTQRYHGSVRCLVFDEHSGVLLVGGDGAGPAAASPAAQGAGGSSSGAGGAAAGITLSVWKAEGSTLRHAGGWGRSGGPGLVSGAVGGVLGAYSVPPRPWRAGLSPLGEFAALVTHGHRWEETLCRVGGGG